VDMAENSFVPGLATQLQGAKAGEKRTINVEFPADFVTPELAGKKAVYEVEVVEVKEKKLPPIDDSFAKTFSAENLEKLKEGVRRDLENELKFSQSKNIRSQLVRAMLDRVNFELPESALAKETRNVVYNLVQENARRGLSRDMIEGHKEQIYTAAAANARERVKFAFLMQKVAEKEDIKVSDAELSERIVYLSRMYDLPPQKFAEDLRKKNGLIEVYDQVMNEKVLEFLEKNAKIEDVEPAAAEAVGTNPS
jgi:trigger factor